MRTFKKLLPIIFTMAFIMVLFIIMSVCVSAEIHSGTCGDGLSWNIDDENCLIISGMGEMETYASDSDVPWYTFRNSVKSAVICEGVTSLSANVFSGFTELTDITIPNSLKKIDCLFVDCKKLQNVYISDIISWCNIEYPYNNSANPMFRATNLYLNGELIVDLVIPKELTVISRYAFSGCDSILTVTIPETVTKIDDNAFLDCDNIRGVYISDLATWCNIEFADQDSNPLSNTYNLYLNGVLVKELAIPDSVTVIGNYAFYNCAYITSVIIPDSVEKIGIRSFYGCKSLADIDISNNVKIIGRTAFYNTKYYNTSANWEYNILYIGKHLIRSETSYVGSYDIKSGTRSIAVGAFEDCKNLTAITIPHSVAAINSCAFEDCFALKTVTIGVNVSYIGESVFFRCGSLEKITVTASNPYYTSIDDVLFDKAVTTLIHYPAAKNTTAYYIPDTVKIINQQAFFSADKLEYLNLPSSITEFGYGVFYYCTSLKSITISEGITNIGAAAFMFCTSLEKVIIPDTVTRIESSAFSDCTSLKSVVIPNSISVIEDSVFYNCVALNSVTIPEGVTSIGSYAFYRCVALKNIVIPQAVTNIGDSAFEGCENLTIDCYFGSVAEAYAKENGIKYVFISVEYGTCGDDLVWILDGDGVFTVSGTGDMYDYSLVDIEYNTTLPWDDLRSDIKQAIIEDGVTSIGAFSFFMCDKLEKVSISNTVTVIGNDAFCGCLLLEEVSIPSSVTEIDTSAFAACESIKSVVLPKTLTTLGGGIFLDCISLENAEIEEGVNIVMSDYIFSGCTSLESIVIPSGSGVGWGAFMNCTSLKTVTFLDESPYIWGQAFQNCPAIETVNITSLKGWCEREATSYGPLNNGTAVLYLNGEPIIDLIIPEGVTEIPAFAFEGYGCLKTVVIPDGVVSIDSFAFANCPSLTYVTVSDSVTQMAKNEVFSMSENVVIRCSKDFYAERYAIENDIPYEYINFVTGEKEFADINESYWFYDSVTFVVSKGYMNGMSATKFSPNSNITREQFVLILANIAGVDTNEFKTVSSGFADVPTGQWYSGAVTWAVREGYVSGMSPDKFGRGQSIQRAALARMLYNYAEKNGIDTTGRADLSSFGDAGEFDKVGNLWMKEPVQWAVHNGIISGMSVNGVNCVNPKGTATRAQAARMLMIFDTVE
ncbi:MAG: leucine-rich repeat protein [Clostridia bacterium]|nr:leucine-rich repeat protein [Clostridia bacterium]